MKFIALIATCAFFATSASIAHAHAGHEDEAPAQVSAERAQRLSDGGVFMPKASQRSLGVRTQLAKIVEAAPALVLEGRVIADPASGGLLQAPFAGRIDAPAEGLPRPGATLKAGRLIAWLTPLGSGPELASLRASRAEIEGRLAQARARVARLNELDGSVPKKDIEDARSELAALPRQLSALAGGADARIALRAPVAGRLAGLALQAGQIVEARQELAQIVPPRGLLVEARSFDAGMRRLGEAQALIGTQRMKLAWIGTTGVMREQAVPVWFRIEGDASELAIGAPARVFARHATLRKGVVLPAAALSGDQNSAAVWLHTGAERFMPRSVKAVPLDAGQVLVTEGLAGGERVVVAGATLISQVR